MAEWLKAHAWKACIRETVSWVRIPLPPPAPDLNPFSGSSRGAAEAQQQQPFPAGALECELLDWRPHVLSWACFLRASGLRCFSTELWTRARQAFLSIVGPQVGTALPCGRLSTP